MVAHIFNSVTEQIEDLTMRLEGPQGPPGAGFPGAPGEPGPQGPQGALFWKKVFSKDSNIKPIYSMIKPIYLMILKSLIK